MTPPTLTELMASYPTPPSDTADLGRAFAGVRAGVDLLAAVELATRRIAFLRSVHGAVSSDVAAVMLALELAAERAARVLGEPEQAPVMERAVATP